MYTVMKNTDDKTHRFTGTLEDCVAYIDEELESGMVFHVDYETGEEVYFGYFEGRGETDV